jgi:hypothetical protein
MRAGLLMALAPLPRLFQNSTRSGAVRCAEPHIRIIIGGCFASRLMSRPLPEKSPRLTRAECRRAALYVSILLWINIYICRELFSVQTAYMNSMHGFWIALAKLADSGWFRATWWPYWDGGIPFEFTYSPLVPGLMSAWASLTGIPLALALQRITGIAYCLAPITLFLAAWLITRAPGASFAAALIYSLTAPTQLLIPDAGATFASLWDPRRLMLVSVWDDTPHLIALAFLPLSILFLSLSIRKRQFRYYAAAVISISAATMASAFGPITVAMAAMCLLFVLERETFARNLAITVGIGAFSYAMSAAFLPPSLIRAMRAAAASRGESGFTIGSLTALAIVTLGWTVLWYFLPRWTTDWRMQFFALFAYLTGSIPVIAIYLHRQFLPQPTRYKMEMEMALAMLIPFLCRPWFDRLPVPIWRAAFLLLVAMAAEQLIHQRQYAKQLMQPRDVGTTIESRVSVWVANNLSGVRIMMPGSIAQWANVFAAIPQFTGSSWSEAYNPVQQRASDAVYSGGSTAEQDARTSLLWLKAFGVGAIAISGKDSQEYWKPFAHAKKFDGMLPVLWREDDVTIYKIPQRSASLAHVVPESALVRGNPATAEEIEPYTAALDDETLPAAESDWDGRNRMRIRTSISAGQVISIQVSHHPGWHASVNGRTAELHRDGLGLMSLKPPDIGPCDILLNYDGGTELRLARYLSYSALFIFVFFFPARRLIMK